MTEEKKKVGFFTDSEGNKSSTRLISFIGAICIIGVWTLVSLKGMKVEPFGYELAALLAVFVGGKVGGAFMEKRNGN